MAEIDLGQGWHIDKRFTVGHVITTVVVGVSALMYVTSVEKRVTLLEAKMEMQNVRFEQVVASMNRNFDKMESHLIRIEHKLDKKVDK